MRLEFHRQVASDISRLMDYYENRAGLKLADDFYAELHASFQEAVNLPKLTT